jgi:hypothetical protein
MIFIGWADNGRAVVKNRKKNKHVFKILRGYQYVHIQDLLKHFSLSRTLCHVE